jgi:hypothetical protein
VRTAERFEHFRVLLDTITAVYNPLQYIDGLSETSGDKSVCPFSSLPSLFLKLEVDTSRKIQDDSEAQKISHYRCTMHPIGRLHSDFLGGILLYSFDTSMEFAAVMELSILKAFVCM